MLDGGIIQRLLEEKWKTFARVNKLIAIQVKMTCSLLIIISNNTRSNTNLPESILKEIAHFIRSFAIPVAFGVYTTGNRKFTKQRI